MLCQSCRSIDFLPLDQWKHRINDINDRSNEAFLYTAPNSFDEPEIRAWERGEGTIQAYYFHHATGVDLVQSAQTGCYLCAVMSFALFENLVTLTRPELGLQKLPQSLKPIILATVLHPGYSSWRDDPQCSLIRLYCGASEARLDVLDVYKDEPLHNSYFEICNKLEAAWTRGETESYLSSWSSLNLQLATSWYRNCCSSHETCQVGIPQLPKRVIDIGEPATNAEPILIEPTGPTFAHYVTLSHCWGDGRPLVPVDDIPGASKSWSLPPMSEWEPTFQDAIKVAKALNLRYLWIDAPCILQEPANRLDWEIESVKMARYFQNAALCICATHASSGSDGLFSLRNPFLTFPCYLRLPSEDHGQEFARFICAGKEEMLWYWEEEGDVNKSPLHSRAWCLQEELLSPRMIRFGRKRLYWQCLTTKHSESFIGRTKSTLARADATFTLRGTDDVKMHIEIPRYSQEWGGARNPYYDAWYHMLHRFNLRNISYQNDILPAISGVAEAFYPHLNQDEYLAGLWRQDLAIGLLWYTASFDPIRPKIGRSQKNFDKSSLYAPSWSWISMADRPLLFGYYKRLESSASEAACATLLRADITLKNKDSPFGLITSGTLTFLTKCPRIAIMPDVKQTPNFHEEFYFSENSTHRNSQPRPMRRMELNPLEWKIQSKSEPRSPITRYQLIGQCDLDDYHPESNDVDDVQVTQLDDTLYQSPTTIINAFFLPLKTDRAEFGRIRTVGLLLIAAHLSEFDINREYYKRIGCGKLDMGLSAWKACKSPTKEIHLI